MADSSVSDLLRRDSLRLNSCRDLPDLIARLPMYMRAFPSSTRGESMLTSKVL